MRMAVTVEPHVMVLREVDPPTRRPGHALVEVEAVGLCGSDYHLFSGRHPYASFPQTQGHEFSGRVVQLDSDYDGPVILGDRVAVEPVVACGRCFACRRNRYNCCARLQVMGAHLPGALAEQVVVPVGSLHPVGDLSAELAALVEPVSIGLQAVRRGQVAAGDTVVVLGAGPIGLAATLSSVAAGARLLVVDRIADRLERARELGAEVVVDATSQDVAAAVADWTSGEGAAVVVEATGVPALLRTAFDLVAASGAIVVVGIGDGEVAIPVIEFSRKEVSVYGSRNSAGVFADAVALVQGHAALLAPWVTHRFTLDQAPEAIAFAESNPEIVEKVVITMGDGR